MAKRHNHYEAAFENWLRDRRVPYVAVDEARRSLVADGSLKSVDYLVSPPGAESLIVDIKGRQFPSGKKHKQYWRNWSTRDDLRSLAEWARYFGPGFTPVLVFAYHVTSDRSPVPLDQLWTAGDRTYGFIAIRLAEYLLAARTLSAKWDTVSMPTAEFREKATSWQTLLRQHADAHAANIEPVWHGDFPELQCV